MISGGGVRTINESVSKKEVIYKEVDGEKIPVTQSIINPKVEDAKDALKSLGYNNNEIKNIIPILEQHLDLSTSELIKLALKNISAHK